VFFRRPISHHPWLFVRDTNASVEMGGNRETAASDLRKLTTLQVVNWEQTSREKRPFVLCDSESFRPALRNTWVLQLERFKKSNHRLLGLLRSADRWERMLCAASLRCFFRCLRTGSTSNWPSVRTRERETTKRQTATHSA